MLLIICVLNKYCDGHLICCGVLPVLVWPRNQRKCGNPDMVLKRIPHGTIVYYRLVRIEPVNIEKSDRKLERYICTSRVNGF